MEGLKRYLVIRELSRYEERKALEMSPKEQENRGAIREGQMEKQDGDLQLGGESGIQGEIVQEARWGQEDNQAQHGKDRRAERLGVSFRGWCRYVIGNI